MFIIWLCAIAGLSLISWAAYQMYIGNVADGSQIGASISLLAFTLAAWSQTRSIDAQYSHFTTSSHNRDALSIQSVASSSEGDALSIQSVASSSEGDALSIQSIISSHNRDAHSIRSIGDLEIRSAQNIERSEIQRNENGMRLVGPEETIPEEAICSMCGLKLQETRYEYGGLIACTQPDCGRWYHREHFSNMASGRCQSPECRRRWGN